MSWQSNFYPLKLHQQMPKNYFPDLVNYWMDRCYKQCEAENANGNYETEMTIDRMTVGFDSYDLDQLISRVIGILQERKFEAWRDSSIDTKIWISWKPHEQDEHDITEKSLHEKKNQPKQHSSSSQLQQQQHLFQFYQCTPLRRFYSLSNTDQSHFN